MADVLQLASDEVVFWHMACTGALNSGCTTEEACSRADKALLELRARMRDLYAERASSGEGVIFGHPPPPHAHPPRGRPHLREVRTIPAPPDIPPDETPPNDEG